MTRYLEDLEPGVTETSTATYQVSAEEIIAFAERWDPLPWHIDAQAASPYGGLIASGSHIMAIRTWLLHRTRPVAVLGALGWDQVRFVTPVRPGDEISLVLEVVEARASRSKADRGVVRSRITLYNQRNEMVMSHDDAIIVARRPAPG